MMNCEALVIGGGPVGQIAALCLLERGVSVEVLDAGGEHAVRGYACGLHPETLRIFDQLGLMPQILEAAHRIDRLSVFGGPGGWTCAELGAIDGKFPYSLALRQFDLEEILRQTLERRGAQLHRHHAVTHVYRRNGFVTVTGSARHQPSVRATVPASDVYPQPFEYKANYVVGADGYFSACRRALGIELTKVRPTRAFAVCEFNADLRGWEREARIDVRPDAVTAFWPLGAGLGRFTLQVFRGLDEVITLEALRDLLRERAPWFEPVPDQLCWGAVAPFEHALAQRFGDGRVWLAGDAAHSTSPIGFQSMNRGFSEARALADAIAAELFDEAPTRHPFARFEREQRAEWMRLLGHSAHHVSSPEPDSELAPCLPASGEDFEVLLGQLGTAAQLQA